MGEEYQRDYDVWNKVSKEINNSKFIPYFHEREVWWCALGLNIGSEQDGKNDLFERLKSEVFNQVKMRMG